MWNGAEPVEGQFNSTYFDIMGEIVDNLAVNGIIPFLDIHQDVLSSYYCLYDGAPKWYSRDYYFFIFISYSSHHYLHRRFVDYAEPPAHPFPWPLSWDGVEPCTPGRGWGSNYFAEATGKAFQGLYHNHNGMRDKFATFFGKVTEYFKNKPILGYEM